jgi:hypothetical protein
MRVVELTDIARVDAPVHYRRVYTANAVYEIGTGVPSRAMVRFTLEHVPLGPIVVDVKFVGDPDYPRVPLVAALKEHIHMLEADRKLP